MRRRDFLKSSALASMFPAALTTGCGEVAGRQPVVAEQGLAGADLIFNRRITGRDPAVVSSDIRGILQQAVDGQRSLRVLGGGHGYLGRALVKDGFVADMRPYRAITFDRANCQATVQAGARFIEVYKALVGAFGADLPYVLPTGDCPTVGVAGYTLGGGYGHFSRTFGLMCDNVVGLRVLVVTPSGQIVEKSLGPASVGEDADLFWALRGTAGARFGVVTEFTYQLRQRPAAVRVYDVRLKGDLGAADIEGALTLWLSWAREHMGDPSMSAKLALGSSWFHLSGLTTDMGKVQRLRDALSAYLDPNFPNYDLAFAVESLTRAFKQCNTLDECAAQPQQAFAAKSAFVSLPLVEGRVAQIAQQVLSRRASYSTYGGIELMAWHMQGGVDTNNAFLHRDHDFLCQFYTEGTTDESDPWMKAMFSAVTSKEANDESLPGYQNYADATVAGAETDFSVVYFPNARGESPSPVERLRMIKGRYRDVFA